ncbi:hypothetical protein [Halococcus sp. PRR34]|uniref:hypothetical protein n=1 Tax=Halococcus sp. PRR34 TaxID=3020830 RepID=UPI0023610E47|nr:hypothetical protein [Halococcus sp. PRR34]
MSTDPISDTDTDAKPAFEPRDGEYVSGTASTAEPATESDGFETDDRNREGWKAKCRECSELVPAKPYCYECGAARPADGDYYVAEEVENR